MTIDKTILFLNLPNKEQITRRYMCSYVSPESLLPPLELISLAAIARNQHYKVKLVDAIAEKKSEKQITEDIIQYQPEIITTIIGFECYQEDIDCIQRLKTQFPAITFITFGYYATEFPEETLRYSLSDFVISGEPDLIFNHLVQQDDFKIVEGICYLEENKFIKQGKSERVQSMSKLPMPAYDLLKANLYYEPFVDKPYGMIQSMRGCPYKCNYCVKSFGTFTTSLTANEIIEHIQMWIKLHRVKTIRFIDDTFTLNRKRVVTICNQLIEHEIKISWMCLSRVDNLDDELLALMSRAGCKRIYLGIESGSESILEKLNKKMDVTASIDLLKRSQKTGIEFAGFFLGGLPFESDSEFKASIRFAQKSDINFASYNPMTPYPGTALFNQFKDEINFSIYPYKNEWKNKEILVTYEKRKKQFYKQFYFRFRFLLINNRILLKYIQQAPLMGYKLIQSLLLQNKFVIGGIKKTENETS